MSDPTPPCLHVFADNTSKDLIDLYPFYRSGCLLAKSLVIVDRFRCWHTDRPPAGVAAVGRLLLTGPEIGEFVHISPYKPQLMWFDTYCITSC